MGTPAHGYSPASDPFVQNIKQGALPTNEPAESGSALVCRAASTRRAWSLPGHPPSRGMQPLRPNDAAAHESPIGQKSLGPQSCTVVPTHEGWHEASTAPAARFMQQTCGSGQFADVVHESVAAVHCILATHDGTVPTPPGRTQHSWVAGSQDVPPQGIGA